MFAKWQDESTPIRLSATLPCGVFEFTCRITSGDSTAVSLRLDGEGNTCEFSLADFGFDFGSDPAAPDRRTALICARPPENRLSFIVLEE